MSKKKIDDGGKAFPQSVSPQSNGMTRRQYLAGLAMQGFIINPTAWIRDSSQKFSFQYKMAYESYSVADAMIAFEKQEEGK
jgi:glutathione synthase/RimK-type ligase-like ATP-grasp enzyme